MYFRAEHLEVSEGPMGITQFSSVHFISVQLLSRVWLFATPWTVAHEASLSITSSRNFLKLMSIELVIPSNHLILCRPLLLPSIYPSVRVFSNESVLLIRWPKYWSFSFSISPSNDYSGLISFGMDWLDLLAVWGTLKSLLQHHSLKAPILWCLLYCPTLFSLEKTLMLGKIEGRKEKRTAEDEMVGRHHRLNGHELG